MNLIRNALTFRLSRQHGSDTDPIVVTPVIDGRPLDDMIEDFENNNGFNDPAGGYGGIIPSFFRFGPLDLHFLGTSPHRATEETIVLGCQCGEVGCWPLECEIKVDGDLVTWRGFRQPYRTERDYSQFGPFVFALGQYQEELGKLVRAMKGFDDES
jgi:hypothetical protein